MVCVRYLISGDLCQSGDFLQFFIFVFTQPPHLLRINFNYPRPGGKNYEVMKAKSFSFQSNNLCLYELWDHFYLLVYF